VIFATHRVELYSMGSDLHRTVVGSITDQGTAGRPAYGQPGHAAGCEHLAADIATWSEASA
jgi:hypothetical protein